MPKHLLWDITYNCNLRCIHCYNAARLGNNNSLLIYKHNFEEIVNRIKLLGVSHVHMLGGEPLCVKDLPLLIDLLYNEGIEISINTNATLMDENLIRHLLKKVSQITISLDGLKKSNDEIRGSGVFDCVIEKLIELKHFKEKLNSATKIHIAIVANSRNIEEIHFLPRVLSEMNVDSIMLMKLYECQDACINYTDLSISVEQFIQMLPRFIYNCYKYNIEAHIDSKPKVLQRVADRTGLKINSNSVFSKCQAGREFIYMDAYGYIYPCSPLSHTENVSKLKMFETSTEEVTNSLLFTVNELQKESRPIICGACIYREHCAPCKICGQTDSLACELIDEMF